MCFLINTLFESHLYNAYCVIIIIFTKMFNFLKIDQKYSNINS